MINDRSEGTLQTYNKSRRAFLALAAGIGLSFVDVGVAGGKPASPPEEPFDIQRLQTQLGELQVSLYRTRVVARTNLRPDIIEALEEAPLSQGIDARVMDSNFMDTENNTRQRTSIGRFLGGPFEGMYRVGIQLGRDRSMSAALGRSDLLTPEQMRKIRSIYVEYSDVYLTDFALRDSRGRALPYQDSIENPVKNPGF